MASLEVLEQRFSSVLYIIFHILKFKEYFSLGPWCACAWEDFAQRRGFDLASVRSFPQRKSSSEKIRSSRNNNSYPDGGGGLERARLLIRSSTNSCCVKTAMCHVLRGTHTSTAADGAASFSDLRAVRLCDRFFASAKPNKTKMSRLLAGGELIILHQRSASTL